MPLTMNKLNTTVKFEDLETKFLNIQVKKNCNSDSWFKANIQEILLHK